MYKSFLTVLLDGKVHTIKEEKQQVIKDFRLSENEIAELLPSCGCIGRMT
jgi:mrr restriction system protein